MRNGDILAFGRLLENIQKDRTDLFVKIYLKYGNAMYITVKEFFETVQYIECDEKADRLLSSDYFEISHSTMAAHLVFFENIIALEFDKTFKKQ